MRIQKTISIVVLGATLIALAFATPAFALYGNSGYTNWNTEASSSANPAFSNPHHGYTTTTRNCGVCHAVHNASTTGQVLLSDTIANACIYCHVGGAGGYTQVYLGQTVYYNGGGDLVQAHNSYVDGSAVEQGVTCGSCHQTHAAESLMTLNEALTTKLLTGEKVLDPWAWTPAYDLRIGTAPQPLAVDSTLTALTKWCTHCHKGGTYGYYSQAYNDDTHVMTSTISGSGRTNGDKVAWAPSQYCSSCHASGYGTPAWPHYTPGAARFLMSSTGSQDVSSGAANYKQDGVCLRCHRSGIGSGVGQSF